MDVDREDPHAAAAVPQVNPVDVSDGHFEHANIGPSTTTVNRNVEMGTGDFRGAHIGPTNITYNVIPPQGSMGPPSMDPPRPRVQRGEDRREGGGDSRRRQEGCETSSDPYKLSDTIWMFKDIQLAKKAYVFAGEMRSGVLGNRPLAIKCITNYKAQSIREAKNLVKLVPHTNVVSIVHSDTYTGGPMKSMYIAMERCSTTTYKVFTEDRRAKNVPFNLKMAQEHTKQVIEAIKHIHDNNIMHRDLKPGSILFSLCGKHIKIIDFGMSKELIRGRSTTHLSTLEPGIDGFRAPEIYNQDNSVSKMADIFSLALVLYYFWSYGFHPFGAEFTIWIHNIKKGICCDMKSPKIPMPEMALALLQRMLSFNRAQRPKIEEVRADPFIKQDWIQALTQSLRFLWGGEITYRTDESVLACKVYQSPTLQDDLGIDASDLVEMSSVQNLNFGNLMNVVDAPPSGYLITPSKDVLKKLTEELTRTQTMAWIDISKANGKSRVIVLLSQPDYPEELFGFFLPDPQILISMLQNAVSRDMPPQPQPRVQEAPSSADGNTLPRAAALPRMPSEEAPASAAPSARPAPSREAPSAIDTAMEEEPEVIQEIPSPSPKVPPPSAGTEFRHSSAGIVIPWWIYTGSGSESQRK